MGKRIFHVRWTSDEKHDKESDIGEEDLEKLLSQENVAGEEGEREWRPRHSTSDFFCAVKIYLHKVLRSVNY